MCMPAEQCVSLRHYWIQLLAQLAQRAVSALQHNSYGLLWQYVVLILA
jgi:hypothetical protein